MTAELRTSSTPTITNDCDVAPAIFDFAQDFITRWYASDRFARRALKVDTGFRYSADILPRPMDSIEAKAEHRCDGEDHSLYHHGWMRRIDQMAKRGKLTHALMALDVLETKLGIEPVDIRRLAPFEGDRKAENPPTHVQNLLDRIGIDPMTYRSLRYRSATPPRTNISCFSRFEHEESAKLLRELHLTGAKLAGIGADPELGKVPSKATEPGFLDGVDLAALIVLLQDPDGHGFYSSDTFRKLGFDPRVVDTFCRNHESDGGDPMRTIFDNDGNVIEMLVAVNELEFLWILAVETGADITEAAWKHGRGTQARNLAAAILDQLALRNPAPRSKN